jgi:DNA-binding PadR family transcriptional regulator
VSRGEVRSAILRLLSEQPMHGYQVMQELEDRSGGGWQPSPGSVYPTLQQLSDEGLIVNEAQEGKNVFSLTAAGQEAAEQLDQPPAWERFGGDDIANLVHLRQAMFQLVQAVKQVSATGTGRQVEAANIVLKDARKTLYRLLADDDE